MRTIRWGIIGCGDVTEVKSGPGFQKARGSILVAVMRRTAELAMDYAQRHGVPKWYDDAEALIQDPDVDAIYIATPPASHKAGLQTQEPAFARCAASSINSICARIRAPSELTAWGASRCHCRMKRVPPAWLALAASVFSIVPLADAVASAGTDRPFNVLLIISDDLRADLGCYGHPLAQTPNLDRLASQGVRFDRAYCQYPLCNPSRTSMLTGRHPTTTNLYGNREWFGAAHPDWVSLPKHFKEHRYATLRAGKIFHGGIDDTEAWTEGGEPRRWGDAPAGARQPVTTPPARAIAPEEEKERITRVVAGDVNRAASSDRWEAVEGDGDAQGDTKATNRAIEYLRRYEAKEQPFFLALGLSKPHSPLVAPKRFFDLYPIEDIELPPDFAPRPTVPPGFPAGSIRPNNADLFIRRDASEAEAREMIRAYLACVSYVDWNVGRVLAELDTLGLSDNTIVMFWSDHGYQLGEKGKWSKAGSLWEQGARVPFIVRDPRAKGNGTPSPRVVQAVDIYVTLADLCGIPAAQGLEGRSLRPLLENPRSEWNYPAFTVWNERSRGITGVVVRTERWRYAEFFGPGAGAMLIDPENDPHELTNLAHEPKYADVVRELSALIQQYAGGKTEATPAATAAR